MTLTTMRAPNGSVFTTTNPAWHQDCTPIPRKDAATARRDYCRSELRNILRPGQTVYCILRHCSASGMTRRISLAIIDGTKLRTIDHLAADAMGAKLHKSEGIIANGCGMDMGFHLVYNLGRALWPDGTPTPHSTRNGEPDSDGGYALKSSWV
jgi:hypothetical protein